MNKPWLILGLVGLLAFTVYLKTLAPTITWRNDGADSGDLAAAVAVNGVPHPPGYPTYLAAGELFQLIPVGDTAYRLNLLSATCAALTVMITGLFIYRTLLHAGPEEAPEQKDPGRTARLSYACAISASLSLAFSGVFWSQAVIAEVYMLNLLLAAALLYGAERLNPAHQRWLIPGMLGLLGLGLGNQPLLVLLVPALLAGISRVRWNRALILAALTAFCAGLSIYLIIPLRAAAQPPVNWGAASTWSGFWWLVSAAPYRQFLFDLPWQFVPPRAAAGLYLLAETFMWWGFPVGWLGWLALVRRCPALAYGSLASFGLFFVYAIGYNTTDSYVYLLPALLIFSLWLGWGLYRLGHGLQKVPLLYQNYRWVNFSFVFLALVPLWFNFSDQNISRDDEAYRYAQRVLESAGPGAMITTDNEAHTFALWYLHYGLGVRPDVTVINSNLLPYPWYRQNLRQTYPHLGKEIDEISLDMARCQISLKTIRFRLENPLALPAMLPTTR